MNDARYTEEGYCHAEVEERDTYRYSGGKQQFRLHYIYRHCKRKAVIGNYCSQHAKINEWWESRLTMREPDGAYCECFSEGSAFKPVEVCAVCRKPPRR